MRATETIITTAIGDGGTTCTEGWGGVEVKPEGFGGLRANTTVVTGTTSI